MGTMGTQSLLPHRANLFRGIPLARHHSNQPSQSLSFGNPVSLYHSSVLFRLNYSVLIVMLQNIQMRRLHVILLLWPRHCRHWPTSHAFKERRTLWNSWTTSWNEKLRRWRASCNTSLWVVHFVRLDNSGMRDCVYVCVCMSCDNAVMVSQWGG